MITTRDKIEQFKRDMRSYDYYLKKVVVLNQELEAIGVKLEGVSSPHAKDVICENSRNPYANNKLELMYQEGEVVDQRNHYLREIEMIDEALNKLNNTDKELLRLMYINHYNQDKLATSMHMSRNSLLRLANKIIKQII